MTGVLPDDISFEAFRAWRADPSLWLPTMRDIARGEALPHETIELFADGTNLVVALGASVVLKLFPPQLRHQFRSECAALSALANSPWIFISLNCCNRFSTGLRSPASWPASRLPTLSSLAR